MFCIRGYHGELNMATEPQVAKQVRPPSKRTARTRVVLALCLLLPGLLGGCPDFRNSMVDAIDAATRGILLGGVQPEDAAETAVRGVVNAALDLFFDQLRIDETR